MPWMNAGYGEAPRRVRMKVSDVCPVNKVEMSPTHIHDETWSWSWVRVVNVLQFRHVRKKVFLLRSRVDGSLLLSSL